MKLAIEAPSLAIYHPIVVPDDPQTWMRECIAGDIVASRDDETDLGWPVVLVDAVRPDGISVRCAFYRFLHLIAGVVVAETVGDAVLLRARIDLRGDAPVIVSDLWT